MANVDQKRPTWPFQALEIVHEVVHLVGRQGLQLRQAHALQLVQPGKTSTAPKVPKPGLESSDTPSNVLRQLPHQALGMDFKPKALEAEALSRPARGRLAPFVACRFCHVCHLKNQVGKAQPS